MDHADGVSPVVLVATIVALFIVDRSGGLSIVRRVGLSIALRGT